MGELLFFVLSSCLNRGSSRWWNFSGVICHTDAEVLEVVFDWMTPTSQALSGAERPLPLVLPVQLQSLTVASALPLGRPSCCQKLPAHFRCKDTLQGTDVSTVPAQGSFGEGRSRGSEIRRHLSEPCTVPLKWGNKALQANFFTWKVKWQFACNYEPLKDK